MRMRDRLLLVGLCMSGASCGTMHGPAELSLGEPRQFETVEVRRRVVEPAEDAQGPRMQPLPDEVLGDVVRLVMQGKIGPDLQQHPIECVMYEGEWAREGSRDRRESRGVCVVVPGLLGTHSSGALVKGLIDDRWTVAVVWPPLVDRAKESMRESDGRSAAERGVALARAVDALIENAARVAQSALISLQTRRPHLQGKPVLIVGESMGAMAGIGMAATGEVPFDAALFVAGGGDLITVTRGSSLRAFIDDDGLADSPEFIESYLRECRFDPLRAGEALRGGPVAVITAADDGIVPTSTQEALWTTLGEPPRFLWDGGHFELFWRSESTIVPVARRIADSVGDRSRAAEVLYRRVLEVVTPEEDEAARQELREGIRLKRGDSGAGDDAHGSGP